MADAIWISILILTLCIRSEGHENHEFKTNKRTGWFAFQTNASEDTVVSSDYSTELLELAVPERLFNSFGGESIRHLILTKYIKDNRLKEGVAAAKVRPPLLKNVQSYSGFFEVDASRESYMFFMLFPCIQKLEIRRSHIPVIVWLQGGIGYSSMYAAFRGNGPIRIEKDGSLVYNNYSWAQKAHLVYFDNPVGAGYSYTMKKGYPKDTQEVAEHLHTALEQLLTLFRLKRNPLYIASQDYGGKYITSLGAKIRAERKFNKIKLQGVLIGNGFIDPPNMLRYGALMYQLGFIDGKMRNELGAMGRQIHHHLRKGNDEEALELYEQLAMGNRKKGITPRIIQISGLSSLMNYKVVTNVGADRKILHHYFNKNSVRAALHSGVTFTTRNDRCRAAMRSDTLKSEVSNLKILMNKVRVLLYHGQLSIKNAYPFMLNYLNKIWWHGKPRYNKNKRSLWTVDGEIAGYYKEGGRFTELLIRNAGQVVQIDQPKWFQRMINNFIQKLPLNTEQD